MPNDAVMRRSHALGSVAELAESWGVAAQLERAAALGPAFREARDCAVEISRRAKTLAGSAYTDQRRIVLNAALLEEGREEDRNATFLHECAHVLADLFHGQPCRHGDGWRQIMKLLGEPPETCHRLDYLSRKAHAVVTWRCSWCEEEYHFVRRPRRRISDCYCVSCGAERGRLYTVRRR